jgi:short-subunit dehydrogenase
MVKGGNPGSAVVWRLEGRVAVVTGASSGIGRAVSERLARRGARVALVARSAERLGTVAESIRQAGGIALAVPCDVADARAVKVAHAQVVEKLGAPDILVNAAGFGVWKGFAEVTEAEHQGMMDTMYWGAFHWIREGLPGMRERRRGRVVNVAAASARVPLPVTSGFSAAMAALTALSESLHRELQGSGVGVSCLNPGSVKTAFWGERTPQATIPPLVRWAPKLSAAAVARQAELCIRLGVGMRTFPVFVALLARMNALWYRAGDLMLARWFVPVLLTAVLVRLAIGMF